jgi:PKD repeat protein/archaellum component FlaF (FlaF/FlaG flagellin family)
MKTITLFLSLLMFAFLSNAQQSLPIYNDFSLFNGTNLTESYPGWYEGDGENSPVLGSSAWYASDELFEKAVAVSFSNGTDHRDWVITPSFIATENTKLTFNAALTITYNDPALGFFGHDDSVSIMVKPVGGDYHTVYAFNMFSEMTNQMNLYEVDLSEWAGLEINVAFYATDGNQPTGFCAFHFDDVMIKDAIAIDGQIVKIHSPSMNTCLNENTPVIVEIRNDGYNNLAGIPLRFKVRGASNSNLFAFVEDTLTPGESGVFDIGNLDLSVKGLYHISVETQIPDDTFTINNSSDTIQIENRLPVDLPLPVMTFSEFYSSNLSQIYPDWYEARGAGVPLVIKDTDWQGQDHPQSRGASVYFVNVGTMDWLVGPAITPTVNTYVKFKGAVYLDEFSNGMGSDDKLAVMVSEDCGTTWTEVGAIDQSYTLDTLYTEFAFSLADFSGQNVKVAIYATTGEVLDDDAYLFFIDDLTVTEMWDNDLALTNVISPAPSCGFTNSEILTIEIKNEGTEPVNEFDVSYILNGGALVQENVTNLLDPGETMQYSFTQTLDLTTTSQNEIEIAVIYTADENNTNNNITFNPSSNSFDLSMQGTFFAGFEEGEDLSGWTVENGNNDEQEWTIQNDPQYAYAGTNSYSYFSNSTTVTSDDWLFSPCFQLEAGVTYHVEFWYSNRASAFPESLRLNLTDAQSSSNVDQVIVDLGSIDNNDFLLSSSTFTVATSGTYYLAWEAYGPADQFGLYVDNVSIWQEFSDDLSLFDFSIPRTVNSGDCMLNSTETINVKVRNMGSTSFSAFDLNVSLNGSAALTQSFTQSINPGDTASVVFDYSLLINPGTVYNVQVWVDAAADLNPANDTMALQGFILDDYSTSFEVNDYNNRWTTQSVTGVNEWVIMNDVNNARTGDKYYAIRTDGANGNSANDDWLFSGCYYLEAGKCYELTFWYRSRFSYENLTAYLGLNPDAASMVVELFDDPDFYSNDYLQATALISVEASDTYYLGFHTDGSTSSRYYVIIDDLELKQSTESPVVTVTPHELDREVVFVTEAENVTDFYWDFGDGETSDLQSPSHVYSENGTYNVVLVASSLCGDVEEILTIEQNFPVITADFNYVENGSQVDFTASVSNADFVNWQFGDGNQAYGELASNIYMQSGNYDVVMTAFSPYDYVEVLKTVTAEVGISKTNNLWLSVYPNPAKDAVQITSEYNVLKIELVNMSGQVLQQGMFNAKEINMPLNDIYSGVYVIKIYTREDIIPMRLIKK